MFCGRMYCLQFTHGLLNYSRGQLESVCWHSTVAIYGRSDITQGCCTHDLFKRRGRLVKQSRGQHPEWLRAGADHGRGGAHLEQRPRLVRLQHQNQPGASLTVLKEIEEGINLSITKAGITR